MREKLPLLLAFVGIAAVVATVLYVFNPTYQKTETMKTENSELNMKIADLEQKLEDSGDVALKTEQLELAVRQMYSEFPTNVIVEDAIAEAIAMEKASQVVNGQIEYDEVETAYTPIAETVDEMPDPEGENVDAAAEGTEESAVDATAENIPSLMLMNQPVHYEFVCDLATYMRAAEYVGKSGERNVISGAKIVYDASTGLLGGRIDLDKYYIVGLDKEYEPSSFKYVQTGNQNLFSTVKPDESLTLEVMSNATHNGNTEEATED